MASQWHFSFYFSVFPTSTFCIWNVCFFSRLNRTFLRNWSIKYDEGANYINCEIQKWLLNKIKLNHFYTEVICMVPDCPSVFVKISHYAHFWEVWNIERWISEWIAPGIRLLMNFELPLFEFAWVIFRWLAVDPWNAQKLKW